jgi:hypothetical protein
MAVDRHGRILIVTGTLFPESQLQVSGTARLDAQAAVIAAARALGINASGPLPALPSVGGVERFKNTIARYDDQPYDITAQLVRFPMGAGLPARLAWQIDLETSSWADYKLAVDAQTGQLLYKDNGVTNADGTVYTVQNPGIGGATRTDVTFPAGWVSGQTTSGNNVNAYQDLTDSDSAEYQTSTPASPDPNFQRFNYTFSNDWATNGPHTLQPAGSTGYPDIDAVITQLFYYNNVMHDYLLGFGFNAGSGNFEGSDPVNAEATDGYDDGVKTHCKDSNNNPIVCTNNANFNTQPDGTPSRMQMYMFLNPQRDGAMDGDVIAHEYGHGLSGRLIANGNLGSTVQTGALGEGWSDILDATKWDDPVIGEYVTGNSTRGIRRYSMASSPLKYSNLCGGGCEVHNDGEIWTAAFWDMRTALLARYPSTGKTFAFQLIVDGMKVTAKNPTFLSARDGILAADVADNKGNDTCLIWGAYAGREMGFSASTTGNADTTPKVATDGPASCTPVADIGGPYTTNEGTPVSLNAGGSTENGDGPFTYSWDLNNDGTFGDATGKTPSFSAVGQDGTYPIKVKVTNGDGFSSTASTTVTVNNVTPTVTTLSTNTPQPENSPVTATIVVTDPGWLDSPTATIDWGDGKGASPLSGVLANGVPPSATLTASPSHTYGDNGTFTLTICPSDEAPGACSNTTIVVTNVNPTATIDKTGAIVVNGVATFIGHSGTPMPFKGNSTDPGSDDLTLTWNWGDSTPDVTTSYLNDPINFPGGDPFPSPTINPRDVTDSHSHTFTMACYRTVTFSALDDDAGSGSDNVAVIMTGNSGIPQNAGYWQTQYRPRPTAFSEAQRQCYLAIVGFMSKVFNEVTDASTVANAFNVLFVGGNGGSATQQLDRQLLTAWLNFANGGIEFGQLVDTNGDGTPDTAFSTVLANAESVRLNPASTADQLRTQKNLLERING